MERVPEERRRKSQEIAEQVRRFIESGGKVTEVPPDQYKDRESVTNDKFFQEEA